MILVILTTLVEPFLIPLPEVVVFFLINCNAYFVKAPLRNTDSGTIISLEFPNPDEPEPKSNRGSRDAERSNGNTPTPYSLLPGTSRMSKSKVSIDKRLSEKRKGAIL